MEQHHLLIAKRDELVLLIRVFTAKKMIEVMLGKMTILSYRALDF
jgi:hypothetical protein